MKPLGAGSRIVRPVVHRFALAGDRAKKPAAIVQHGTEIAGSEADDGYPRQDGGEC
jgi:hypothetical protein